MINRRRRMNTVRGHVCGRRNDGGGGVGQHGSGVHDWSGESGAVDHGAARMADGGRSVAYDGAVRHGSGGEQTGGGSGGGHGQESEQHHQLEHLEIERSVLYSRRRLTDAGAWSGVCFYRVLR